MPEPMALSPEMRTAVRRQAHADLVVGIPSFRNAATIGHVARVAAEGLARYFPGMRAVIVNSDGGSNDGTSEKVRAESNGVPAIAGPYVGPSGKGSAFRAIFEAVDILGAKACAVVDSDLRSITPEWIERLIGPVVRGEAQYVTPLYARHKYDGTITNTIAYPLTRALYGARVRQPIGGEFGFDRELAKVYLGEPVWETDVARFGIDIFMTTTALVRGARIAQAFLGAKIHDPKDPGADLGPMFTQVVGTILTLARANADKWRGVKGSREVPVIGATAEVEPEPVNASVRTLLDKFREATAEQESAWSGIFSVETREIARKASETGNASAIGARVWAKAVYELVAATKERDDTEALARALLPLYFARVAALIGEVGGLDHAGSERVVEQQALAFEQTKPSLLERWPASDPPLR